MAQDRLRSYTAQSPLLRLTPIHPASRNGGPVRNAYFRHIQTVFSQQYYSPGSHAMIRLDPPYAGTMAALLVMPRILR